VISDVDIQFFGEVLPLVHEFIAGRDACFQREFTDLGVNIGFMALRRTDASLTFWRRVLDEIPRTGGHDQRMVNNMLYSESSDLGLRWSCFPKEIWASSQVFSGPPPEGILLHHANWVPRAASGGKQYVVKTPDLEPKIAQLKLLRKLVLANDRTGQLQLAEQLAADPQLGLYYERSFGRYRAGPEWATLPKGHPARPGGSRRAVRK